MGHNTAEEDTNIETIKYGLIGRQDIRIGRGTFETTLGDGRVVLLDEVNLDHLDATFSATDTSVSAVSNVLTLRHLTSSGTVAAGIGTRLTYNAHNVTPAEVAVAATEGVLDTVTAGSEASSFYILLRRAGNALSRAFRLQVLGNFLLTLTGTLTANRTLTFPDTTDTIVVRATTETLSNKTLDNTNLAGAGTGTGTYKMTGVINSQNGSVGTPANLTETDLYTYTLPANSLSANGNTIEVYAWGTTAANANTKTIRLYFGGVVIESNDVTTAPNNVNWSLYGQIVRTGATAELSIGEGVLGSVAQTTTFQSLTSDTAASIIIKVTGQNGTGNANEIVGRVFICKHSN